VPATGPNPTRRSSTPGANRTSSSSITKPARPASGPTARRARTGRSLISTGDLPRRLNTRSAKQPTAESGKVTASPFCIRASALPCPWKKPSTPSPLPPVPLWPV
jgi:hypothetical protein